MRKSFGAKPFMYPMPVLIIASYDVDGVPNAMNAAWGAVCDFDKVLLTLSYDHKTVENILQTKAFTVSMATKEQLIPSDYVGIVSGNNVKDKIKNTGWHLTKSELVNAPIIDELPLTLECKFISFDKESESLVGEIVNVSADESILTDGKIDLEKFHPISYDPANHDYLTLGSVVGKAFSDGKKIKI